MRIKDSAEGFFFLFTAWKPLGKINKKSAFVLPVTTEIATNLAVLLAQYKQIEINKETKK